MRKLPRTRSCFVCGRANAHGLNLELTTDEERVETRFALPREFEGFKGVAHGGIIAAILDEAMVWACGVKTKRFCFCAEMTVRYLAPARPGEWLVAVGELTANRRDKLFEARALVRDDAQREIAKATGKYIPMRSDQTEEAMADFEEGARLFT